ncbi:MAG: hypothetical protein NC253_11165 [Ruminococcus sp.]|nr:hypothetical protein [Ruminococcus sp.]MCM1380293.1 hypothetical protein [Muribaculaceae bacterium]MCM1478273.1 hypothetical protein [Muribaculaceae bacterium]
MKKLKPLTAIPPLLCTAVLLSGCGNNAELERLRDESETPKMTTTETTTVTDPIPVVYEYDEIVNKFIVDYNEIAVYPLDNISHNERLDYCTAYSNDLKIQLVGRDVLSKRIDIKIFTASQEEKMLEILPDMLNACNISKDTQISIISEIKSAEISLDKKYDDSVSIFYTKSSTDYLEIMRYLE